MNTLVATHALLPHGWADDVRLDWDDAGRLSAVTPNAADTTGVARAPGVVVPGMPNLHSHAFQRAFAGLAEHRVDPSDSFWSWRDTMYRFANGVDPDQLEDIATHLYVEMLRAGYTAVCEFHYLHHDPQGRPYADRRDGATHRRSGISRGYRPHAAARALPGERVRRTRAAAGAAPLRRHGRRRARHRPASARRRRACRHRAAFAARRPAGCVAGARRGDASMRCGRARAHPHRGAAARGRGQRRVERTATRAVAARARGDRPALVPRARDPRRRERAAGRGRMRRDRPRTSKPRLFQEKGCPLLADSRAAMRTSSLE